MSFYLVVNKMTKEVGESCKTREKVMEYILENMQMDGYDAEDYVVYEVASTFSYIPPADKGQLVRKDI